MRLLKYSYISHISTLHKAYANSALSWWCSMYLQGWDWHRYFTWLSFFFFERRYVMCFYISLLRKQLKLKINRLKAKSLQIPSSISNTLCKTGENKTAAVFDRKLQPKGVWAYIDCSVLIFMESTTTATAVLNLPCRKHFLSTKTFTFIEEDLITFCNEYWNPAPWYHMLPLKQT